VDIFSGLKLAAGGELGIGVGEEDWGSGEREVLEGFVERTGGLVDLVVSRFGEPPPEAAILSKTSENPSRFPIPTSDGQQWLGASATPVPSNGVIFSGVGAITRPSLRDVSSWMQWVYSYGEDAYGVREHPNSAHRRKRRKVRSQVANDGAKSTKTHMPKATSTSAQTLSRHGKARERVNGEQQSERPVGIPPPIVSATEASSSKATAAARASRNHSRTRTQTRREPLQEPNNATSGTDTLMKYLTLGVYGSSWGISAPRPGVHRRVSGIHQQGGSVNGAGGQEGAAMQHIDPRAESSAGEEEGFSPKQEKAFNRFIIGLQGNLEDEEARVDNTEVTDSETDRENGSEDWNNRTLIRTLHVELAKPKVMERASDPDDGGECIANTP